MAIGTPAGHANCFVVVVVIGIGFDCIFSFTIRAKLAAVIDSIVVVVVVLGPVVLIFASRLVGRGVCGCASDWGKSVFVLVFFHFNSI